MLVPPVLATSFLTMLYLTAILPGAGARRERPQEAVLRLTNEFRKAEGLPALKRSEILSKVAQKHAENMARQEKSAHILDGKGFADRAKAAGYPGLVGENVAWNSGKGNHAEKMMGFWKKSPGHRKNMLHPTYSEIGVGMAQGKSGAWYGCQVFGLVLTKFSVQIKNRTKEALKLKVGMAPDERTGESSVPAGSSLRLYHYSTLAGMGLEVAPKPPAKAIKAVLRDRGSYEIIVEGATLKIREVKEESPPKGKGAR